MINSLRGGVHHAETNAKSGLSAGCGGLDILITDENVCFGDLVSAEKTKCIFKIMCRLGNAEIGRFEVQEYRNLSDHAPKTGNSFTAFCRKICYDTQAKYT